MQLESCALRSSDSLVRGSNSGENGENQELNFLSLSSSPWLSANTDKLVSEQVVHDNRSE
jgi:hypothetical protein